MRQTDSSYLENRAPGKTDLALIHTDYLVMVEGVALLPLQLGFAEGRCSGRCNRHVESLCNYHVDVSLPATASEQSEEMLQLSDTRYSAAGQCTMIEARST